MAWKYQTYPDYKDTDVLGLESVPAHWEVQRIKFLFNIGRGRVISEQELEDDGRYPVYSSQTKNNGCLGYIDSYDFDCEQITWTTDGANAGTVFLRRGKHNCTNVCGTLQPKDECVSMDFTLYCLEYVTQFHKRPDTNGAKIMNNEMAEISITQPPVRDREKIANFLDHETAKIDILIEKQQQLIQLLKEKRQTVISHAVTKGLNPNAPMRDSGVEWLGEVPEHWDVTKIGWMCEFISYGFTNPMPSTDEGPYMLTATDVEFDRVKYEEARRTSEEAFNTLLSPKSKPEKGDVLLTKDGTLGRVSVFNGKFKTCISQSVALLRLDKVKVVPEFLSMALSGADYQGKMIFDAGGTTIKHIYISILAKMNFILPTLDEQKEILEMLVIKIGKMDALIQQADKASGLLNERRTALISAAVTGKIDVRNWVAPEPSTTINKEVAA